MTPSTTGNLSRGRSQPARKGACVGPTKTADSSHGWQLISGARTVLSRVSVGVAVELDAVQSFAARWIDWSRKKRDY